jgi:hypothetical protein
MMSPHLSANFIDSWPIEFVDPPRDKAGKAIFSALREIEFPLCDGALIRKPYPAKSRDVRWDGGSFAEICKQSK